MIRRALISDLPVIVDIYNQAINSRCCTGDTVCFTAEERVGWFEAHDADPKAPAFVYENEKGVTAYSTFSRYRPGRPALESVGEISYYVDFNHHRQNIGNELLKHLIMQAPALGYEHIFAILIECNQGSVSLLKKHGFSLWGKMPQIVKIDGQRYSHLYFGLSLV